MKTIDLKKIYDATPPEVVHRNLSETLHEYDVKPKAIVKMLNISIHTAYAYRKTQYPGKPDLVHLMIIAEQLRLDVLDFFKEN